MDPLEAALIILVLLWSLVFLIIGIFLIVVIKRITQALDKINRILQTAENVSEGIGIPLKAAASSLIGMARREGSIETKNT